MNCDLENSFPLVYLSWAPGPRPGWPPSPSQWACVYVQCWLKG